MSDLPSTPCATGIQSTDCCDMLNHPPSPPNEIQAFRLVPGMTMAHRSGPILHLERDVQNGMPVVDIVSKDADGTEVGETMGIYDAVLLKAEMPSTGAVSLAQKDQRIAQLEGECLHLRGMCNTLMDEAKETAKTISRLEKLLKRACDDKDSMQVSIDRLEKENADHIAAYEKERIVWENANAFMHRKVADAESRRDQAVYSMGEAQREAAAAREHIGKEILAYLAGTRDLRG